jgi:hypothetical protein
MTAEIVTTSVREPMQAFDSMDRLFSSGMSVINDMCQIS